MWLNTECAGLPSTDLKPHLSLSQKSGSVENFQHESREANIFEEGIGKGKNQVLRLKSQSETHWCCRIDAAHCCKQHCGAALKTSNEIKDSPDSTSDQKATALAWCGMWS